MRETGVEDERSMPVYSKFIGKAKERCWFRLYEHSWKIKKDD
jgi:hypothetical protein